MHVASNNESDYAYFIICDSCSHYFCILCVLLFFL